jgi:anhydro-N-acetylmuramic acid kinase
LKIDVLATFTEHAAQQISNVFNKSIKKRFVTGGGTYNQYLIEKIRSKTTQKSLFRKGIDRI